MSDIDDAQEFADLTKSAETFKSLLNKMTKASPALGEYVEDEPDVRKVTPGQPVQYQLYKNGYTPTNHTIKTLPSGCYDITADNHAIYVTPMPKPSGLLLELPEMRSEEVVKIVDVFWNSEKDYKEGNDFVIGGAAYKAGIMLYGPPGTGKSCTIKIVANKLVERDGIVFFASQGPHLVMSFLENFTKVEDNRKCIVILEDIDSLIQHWGETSYLEMLDSAKSIDNVLFIATTNYPERLDPRIYNRPGRFSHVIKIGLPSKAAREAYLKAILKNHRDVEYIVEHTKNFSIDHLSSLVNAVYREKKDLKNEIERLRTLFRVPKAEDEREMGIGSSFD